MVKGYSESAEYLGDLIIGDSKLKETYFFPNVLSIQKCIGIRIKTNMV